MFSLIDIKDQYYSKSPDLPNQYKRIIYNNINDFLYDKNKRGLIFKIPQVETSFKKIKPTENEKQKFKMKKNKSEKTMDKSPLIMSRKENGKQYKVLYDEMLSSRIGINYCLCIQWNMMTMEPGNVIYVRAFDKFTRKIFRPEFDTRGFDNVAGTADDVV